MYDGSGIGTIPDNGEAADQFQMATGMGNERTVEPVEYFHKDVGRPITKQIKRIISLPLEAKLDLIGNALFRTCRIRV